MAANYDMDAWLEQMKADTIKALREKYALDTAAGDDAPAQAPSDQSIAPYTQYLNAQGQAPVSVYIGENGRGLVNDAARLMATRQNRINTDDSVIYTAEPHGDPSLPNQRAMVGRRVVAPPSDDSTDAQTNAPYTDEEAAQDLARESRRAPADTAKPLADQYDLSDKSNFKDYLDKVKQRATKGLPIDPQDIATSKALLFHFYGYPMGEQRGTAEELRGNLNDQESPGLTRALQAFSKAPADEQQRRYDFFSNIQAASSPNGTQSRARAVSVTRDGKTLTVHWDPSFSNVAGTPTVGVSADEALRKTDFDVYQAAINAALKTDGVQSININGAWRPHPADFAAIVGLPAPLANANSAHITSRALDINQVNDVAINNHGYIEHAPAQQEPDIVNRLTSNLLAQNGTRQIFQPWHMWVNVGQDPVNNSDVIRSTTGAITGADGNATLHKNHLHFGMN